jgi:ACS family hexuronate transporter-like MFS transporter
MFASTVLNYMDRQTVALVAPQLKQEFRLTSVDFGWVLLAFQLSYALFQVPAGYLVDRWNVRWAYAGAVAWWSLAGTLGAFAPSLGVLMVLRALLGVGESFNWPCALRTTAIILPPADRSLGNGIFNSGAAVGAVVTPLVVPWLTVHYGWRTALLVTGVLGFVWVAAWLLLLGSERGRIFAGRSTAKPALATEGDLAEPARGLAPRTMGAFGAVVVASILVGLTAFQFGRPAIWWGITVLMVGPLLAARILPLQELKGADWALSLGEIVRLRRFWILVVVSVSINVCWHFLVNWLLTYLIEDRGMRYLQSGLLSAVPFLAADVGNLGGGACALMLARSGFPAVRARTLVMLGCTALVTAGALVGLIRSDTVVIALLAIMAMGTAAFMANYFAFTQEVSPRHTGLVVGILGGLGNLFAAGFHPFAGMVKDYFGNFAPVFVLVSVLPWLGMGALVLGWGRADEEVKPS